MDFETMQQAIKQARRTIEVADSVADEIAFLIVGRLRKVRSGTVLKALKAELRNYDMTTGRWKP